MAAHVIVLANRTAAAPELIEALAHRAERGPIHATLVMPAAGPGTAARAECKRRLDAALEVWRAAGIERSDGVVCDPVPPQPGAKLATQRANTAGETHGQRNRQCAQRAHRNQQGR